MFEKDLNGVGTPPGFFPNLGDKRRITLFNTGTVQTLADTDLLFKKGTPGKTIFYVLSGALRVVSADSCSPGYRFKTGDVIAETSFSAGEDRISSIAAEGPSTVFSLDPAGFETLGVEIRSAILGRLHDTVLSRIKYLDKQTKSAQFRQAALTKYIVKSRKHLGNYGQSEIIVNILKSIPRLPLHITQLIELLSGQRASAKDVAALAKQDPSLVVDVLKAINSARYALPTKITDVSYAITYMGFNEVYQIALSRGLMKSIPDSVEFREVYRHSLFLSFIASELCQSYDRNRAALLSTIGLLHDLGQTVLLLLRKQNPKWSLFIDTLDSAKLGAMLLAQWNIPKQICYTIEYQAWPAFRQPADIPSDQKENIALLYVAHAVYDHLANRALDALDHPFLDEYLRLLGFDCPGIAEISRDIVLEGLRRKSQRLPDFVRKLIGPPEPRTNLRVV